MEKNEVARELELLMLRSTLSQANYTVQVLHSILYTLVTKSGGKLVITDEEQAAAIATVPTENGLPTKLMAVKIDAEGSGAYKSMVLTPKLVGVPGWAGGSSLEESAQQRPAQGPKYKVH